MLIIAETETLRRARSYNSYVLNLLAIPRHARLDHMTSQRLMSTLKYGRSMQQRQRSRSLSISFLSFLCIQPHQSGWSFFFGVFERHPAMVDAVIEGSQGN